ncbi:centrosomal protein of 152 kDa-like isoform X2 [Mercenaria mercenaria]|uniref:centrosomal protein of 152 kDa-like isoform X2 n=1 Tax=Mercenaria mercenaria TaxID=6596 RepID=UPI00234F1E59|nr:centrosomal protein of 152 kDa-like isoform X2 [Mercenaria mercenaria]
MNQTEGDDTERLKKAEKKLHEAEQENKVLVESITALKEQVEKAMKSKDDLEESLRKKAKQHADLVETYCNIEKENQNLNQKVFQLEEGENDKLGKESNKQGESIQHLQAVVNRREKDIKAKDHGYQRLLKTSQADKKEYEARLEKREEQIYALNKRLSEFENTKARYATELKRLKEYETIHQTLLDDIRRQEIQLKNAEMDKLSYKKTMQSVERAKQTLWEENQSLLLRLSKIAGANLTHENPNIADLSDGKRPTQLAEEYSELYDNEWTDAFEDHGYQRLLKASQADKKEYEARLEKREEQIYALNKRLSEFENTKARYATELKRLKEYETIHQTLLDDIRRQEIQLKNAEMDKLSYKKTMQSVERAKQTLWEENQSLLLRLSKIAGANLTHENPNIADLSDGKRPTKLAEEFSELYDNEWTDAFEAIEIEDDKEKTTLMLKILQRANKICHELSNAHLQNIKESLCSLTLHIHVPPGNIDKRQTKEMVNGTDNRQTEMNVNPKASLIYLNQQKQNAEWIHAETSTEKNVDDENINKDQSTSEPVSDQQQSQSVDPLREDGHAKHTSHKMHLVEKQEEIDHSNKSSASGKNAAGQGIHVEEEGYRFESECVIVGNAEQINDDVVSDKTRVVPNKSSLQVSDKIQKVHDKKNVAPHQMLQVVYDFEKMPNDQKKVVMELRKFIEIRLSDQLETAATTFIAFEFDLDPEKNELIVEFVRKCMNVCWSMCRQEPPVHIGFPSIQGDQSYDTSIYKPYTKTGKFLDFVVWPAVYLHEGGPLLSKGVAQGRN